MIGLFVPPRAKVRIQGDLMEKQTGRVRFYWTPALKRGKKYDFRVTVEWKNGAANGQFSAYGTDLRMRDLVLHQVSMQCSIVDSVVYLNDVTASMNQQDFVTAKGVSLEGRGVIPDIEVKWTRASLLGGNDPQLEAAINEGRE